MIFPKALIPGRLVRRYKRFLADVIVENERQITVHCPNTGAMLGCQEPGSRVWLSESDNPARKYRHTWELVEADNGVLVGINTLRSNKLVEEAIRCETPLLLPGYVNCRREVPVENGRLDFVMSGHASAADCFIEVKNVTAAVQDGVAIFPDAKSSRASKHLHSLMEIKATGLRAALIFCVQRDDVHRVEPAVHIDPAFSSALAEAHGAGVELYAIGASVGTDGIKLVRQLAVTVPML